MATIKSHSELIQHPDARRLARSLGINVPTAIGHLHLLWHWCLDYAIDGNLGKFEAIDIAEAMMFTGDPKHLINELMRCHFLDANWCIPNWQSIITVPEQRREWNALRCTVKVEIITRDGGHCQHCGTTEDLTIDHIIPIFKGGTNDPANLQTLCRSCNSKKGVS